MSTVASIDTLVDYIEQYRPGYRVALRGASEEEVARLEVLARQKLPDTYRQFLRRMGHDHGGLWMLGQYDQSTYEDVAEYHQYDHIPYIYAPPFSAVTQDCLFIAESEIGGVSLFLYPKLAADPQVVMNKPTSHFAASLLSLLFRVAFRDFRLGALVRRQYFLAMESHGGRDVLPEAVALAEAAGFRRQWFSDRRDFCGERPEQAAGEGLGKSEAALCLSQDDYKTSYGTLVFSVAAATAVEAEHLAAPFLARFGPGR